MIRYFDANVFVLFQAHLIKHISSVHRYQDAKKGIVKEGKPIAASAAAASGNTSDSNSTEMGGKEDFSCCFCGEPFDNKDTIRRHISQAHRDLLVRAQ